jgi:hypothetical protein
MKFFLLTSEILLELVRLSLHERSFLARASHRNALCRGSLQHAGQIGFVLRVGKSCENGKGVSHAAVPIYVKDVGSSAKLMIRGCASLDLPF